MGLMRRRGFLGAVAMSAILALYFALVASRAVTFIQTGDAIAVTIGVALLVLPALGLWWLVHEWRLGTAVQKMADQLEAENRLPMFAGETDAFGRLTEEGQEAAFASAARYVEEFPDDWVAWFHLAQAYDASGDRSMARRSLRHAADLYRSDAERRV